jgi:hypothetical protein
MFACINVKPLAIPKNAEDKYPNPVLLFIILR